MFFSYYEYILLRNEDEVLSNLRFPHNMAEQWYCAEEYENMSCAVLHITQWLTATPLMTSTYTDLHHKRRADVFYFNSASSFCVRNFLLKVKI